MRRGSGLAVVLVVQALACGGRAKDETRLAEPVPASPTQMSVGSEQPAAVAQQSPAASGAAATAPGVPASLQPSALPSEPEAAPPMAAPPMAEGSCESGSERCNGAFVEGCSPEGSWLLLDQCGVCNGHSSCAVLGREALCLPHICCFPDTRCNGQFLEICNATATGFELLQDCGSAAFCDAVSGACLPGCLPGQARCNGAQVERCRADGTGFETTEYCVTAALCFVTGEDAMCASGCSRDEVRCLGLTLMRCNEDQTGYETVAECAVGCAQGGCINADAGAEP